MGVAAWALVVAIGSAVISLGTVGVTVALAARRESFEERVKRERFALESHGRILDSVSRLDTVILGSTDRVGSLEAFIKSINTELMTPYSVIFQDGETEKVLKTVSLMLKRDREILCSEPDGNDRANLRTHLWMGEAIQRLIVQLDSRSKERFGYLPEVSTGTR